MSSVGSPPAAIAAGRRAQPTRSMNGFIAGIVVGIAFAFLVVGGAILWWLLSA